MNFWIPSLRNTNPTNSRIQMTEGGPSACNSRGHDGAAEPVIANSDSDIVAR
ncbi:Uncharacterised protein [Mycobacterium tuberculosis]|uniref:Uncharacterized protein n=1 Tax=Mycobacterium tuberculosis TaxID=1773 RepID=A0A916LFB5_MYCTX|nr:Uncharacterised protein [Mycobacterium tuberculosis]COZ41737.1 Uncharacterised protein [Mycobacterium tuberculosis]COZ98823.1 Uncharacterised protein [Mycobacterium tuberculosis]